MLFRSIKNRNTLPFAENWIYEDLFGKIGAKYKSGLNELLKKNIITGYPPLEDIIGTYTSQHEKTIFVKDMSTIILS